MTVSQPVFPSTATQAPNQSPPSTQAPSWQSVQPSQPARGRGRGRGGNPPRSTRKMPVTESLGDIACTDTFVITRLPMDNKITSQLAISSSCYARYRFTSLSITYTGTCSSMTGGSVVMGFTVGGRAAPTSKAALLACTAAREVPLYLRGAVTLQTSSQVTWLDTSPLNSSLGYDATLYVGRQVSGQTGNFISGSISISYTVEYDVPGPPDLAVLQNLPSDSPFLTPTVQNTGGGSGSGTGPSQTRGNVPP